VRFLVVPDANTAMSMYEAGELDILMAAASLNRRIFGDDALKGQMVSAAAAQVRYLSMNGALYEPFKDKRVREAVCLSLDQDEQIAGLYQGAAVRLNGQITEGVAGFNPDLPPIPHDPDRARQLMAEAGYANGQGLPPIKLTNIESGRAQHLYFASKLEETIGMKPEVEIVERGTMLSGMNSQQLPFFAWGWSAGYPDGLYFLEDLWYGPSPFNKGWKNADFDTLIDKAKQTADADARYQIYHQAEKVLLDDWGMCPLPVVMLVALVKPDVEGVAMTPFRLQPFSDVTITP
jgi:ABC-type transport system substrate-binding protein